VLILSWRVLLHRIPSKVNLVKRGVGLGDTLCELCKEDDKTSRHFFFKCKMAKTLWSMCNSIESNLKSLLATKRWCYFCDHFIQSLSQHSTHKIEWFDWQELYFGLFTLIVSHIYVFVLKCNLV